MNPSSRDYCAMFANSAIWCALNRVRDEEQTRANTIHTYSMLKRSWKWIHHRGQSATSRNRRIEHQPRGALARDDGEEKTRYFIRYDE